MLLNNTLRNIARTRSIIQILLKYGFESVVVQTPLRKLVPRALFLKWKREGIQVSHFNQWQRVRMACEELGPTFIKLAQIISNRPDIIPEGLIVELQRLQSDVAPVPFAIIKKRVEKELGKPLEEVFEYFNEKPIGSASIGVVHKAKLLTGEDVVVKIRRPQVARIMHEDLEIIKYVASKAEAYLEEQGMPNATDAVEAFEKSMLKELDYKNEGKNIESFRNFYKDHKEFYVPKAYRDISTEKILIIEYIEGCKITDIEQLNEWGLNPETIAEVGMDVYLTQIFEFGYFHSDPHPGNILVKPDGTLILIDFGMLGKLMKPDKHAFANVFIAMAREDAQAMALNLKKLSIEDDVDDMKMLEYDLAEIIDEYANVPVADSSIEELIESLQAVMHKYRMRVPAGVFLIFRALAVLEGIGKIMHPNFNISAFVLPYGLRLIKEQYAPKEVFNQSWYKTIEVLGLLSKIPSEMRTILKKTRKGNIRLKIEHEGYEQMLKAFNKMANRLVLVFLIFTLSLTASLLALVPFPIEKMATMGIPKISVSIYGIAIFLAIVLLINMWRSDK